MNIKYGPQYDELALCIKFLAVNALLTPVEEDVLSLDDEHQTIKSLMAGINEQLNTIHFDDQTILLILKISNMNVNALKTFYSNISKAPVISNNTQENDIILPFYANKESFSLADIYLFARTYRYIYETPFTDPVMSYFNILNHYLHKKLNTRLFTDFEYLDIRVGKIIDIVENPNADKLYTLTVLFDEPRIIASALRDHFKKEELLNKYYIFMTNLKKSKLMGVVSNGMILCAKNETLEVIKSPVEIPNAIVSMKGEVVIRNVKRAILDAGKEKYKRIMKDLTVKNNRVHYNEDILVINGMEVEVGLDTATVG